MSADGRACLLELEQLLAEERVALRALDHAAIDALAVRKLELLEALASTPLEAADRPSLERVRRQQLHNQLLLVHARDCVRSVIALATGQRAGAHGGAARMERGRLDIRG